MKKNFFAYLLLGLMISPVVAQDAVEGRWKGEIGFSKIHLRLKSSMRSERGHWDMSWGEDFLLKEFKGLEQIHNHQGVVEFSLPREAGTFTFNGEIQNDKGDGEFKFEVSPTFVNNLKTLGYPKLASDQVFTLAMHDVGLAFIKEMEALGYGKLSLETLVQMVIQDVTPTFVKEMAELGYKKLPIEQLIQLRIHGVDADYVREMNEALAKSHQ